MLLNLTLLFLLYINNSIGFQILSNKNIHNNALRNNYNSKIKITMIGDNDYINDLNLLQNSKYYLLV